MADQIASYTATGPWGLKFAQALRERQPPFYGPLILLSFERRVQLEKTAVGDILNTPGVAFLRLPVAAYDLEQAIIATKPITPAEWEETYRMLRFWRVDLSEQLARLRHRLGSVLAAPLAAANGVLRLSSALPPAELVERYLKGLREDWPALSCSVQQYLSNVRATLEKVQRRLPDLGLADSMQIALSGNRLDEHIQCLAGADTHDSAGWENTFAGLVESARAIQRERSVLSNLLEHVQLALKSSEPVSQPADGMKNTG